METLTGSRTDLQKNTLAIVLAGGRGTRLGPLTNKRVKPDSLYLQQLMDRLGVQALHNIGY